MDAPTRYLPFATTFTTVVTALALMSRSRAEGAEAERSPLRWAEEALAVFYVTRFVAHEKAGSLLRAPFVEQDEDADSEDVSGDQQHPAGAGLKRTAGELLTCTRCLGPWAAAIIVMGRTFAPHGSRVPIAVLALAGSNSLLHGAHSYLADPPEEAPTADNEPSHPPAKKRQETRKIDLHSYSARSW